MTENVMAILHAAKPSMWSQTITLNGGEKPRYTLKEA